MRSNEEISHDSSRSRLSLPPAARRVPLKSASRRPPDRLVQVPINQYAGVLKEAVEELFGSGRKPQQFRVDWRRDDHVPALEGCRPAGNERRNRAFRLRPTKQRGRSCQSRWSFTAHLPDEPNDRFPSARKAGIADSLVLGERTFGFRGIRAGAWVLTLKFRIALACSRSPTSLTWRGEASLADSASLLLHINSPYFSLYHKRLGMPPKCKRAMM